MTEAEREIRALLDMRKGVNDNVYVPVRLGALRAFVAKIDARPSPLAACSKFKVGSAPERDSCAQCGLPRGAHPTDLVAELSRAP